MEYIENGAILLAVYILVEVVKKIVDEEHKRYLPLIAIAIGLVAQCGFDISMTSFTADSVLKGIIMGGATAGIYDLKNKTIQGK